MMQYKSKKHKVDHFLRKNWWEIFCVYQEAIELKESIYWSQVLLCGGDILFGNKVITQFTIL